MRNRPIPGSSGLVREMSLLGDPVLHRPCEDVTD
ncbi:peptide deformylase, partial [Streptomyces sp. SID7982]|nr:peptide deformylase [Streptomyces sp. SID7982]